MGQCVPTKSQNKKIFFCGDVKSCFETKGGVADKSQCRFIYIRITRPRLSFRRGAIGHIRKFSVDYFAFGFALIALLILQCQLNIG